MTERLGIQSLRPTTVAKRDSLAAELEQGMNTRTERKMDLHYDF
jgi:hypothetical protein